MLFTTGKIGNIFYHRTYKNSLYFLSAAKLSYISDRQQISNLKYSTHIQNVNVPRHSALCVLTSLRASTNCYLSTDSKLGSNEVLNESLAKVMFTEPVTTSTSTSEVVTNVLSSSVNDASSSVTEVSSFVTDVSSELSSVADVVEPSLSSLGLCHWTPVGLVQWCLEYLHVSMHMPWWLAIVTATAIVRIVMFPLFVKAQRNASKFANHMPRLQLLQEKFAYARRTGNAMEASRYANEIMEFMKKYDVNPMKNMIIPLIQAPIFISFFFGLRSMAKLPVESMKDGGLWWITDLTVPDPYYLSPLLACGTFYVILKVGAESGMRMENYKFAGYVMQAFPLILFPFIMNFPSAMLFYWCSNNVLTLFCVSLIKINRFREYLGIQKIQRVDPAMKSEKPGFIKSVKEAYNNQKILKAIEDRSRVDEVRFRKAGTGPIPRTYSYDPTKPRPANAAAAAARKK